MTNNQANFQRIVLLLEQRSETRLAKEKPRQMWVCPCGELECDGGCATNPQVGNYRELGAGI
jgi:CDGSH-type Zn-finger protein